jgi:hypothetical protein
MIDEAKARLTDDEITKAWNQAASVFTSLENSYLDCMRAVADAQLRKALSPARVEGGEDVQ